jgi:hypothetical protein
MNGYRKKRKGCLFLVFRFEGVIDKQKAKHPHFLFALFFVNLSLFISISGQNNIY